MKLFIKELERFYDTKQRGFGFYGNNIKNVSSLAFNYYKIPQVEEDIEKEIGISIFSLQNYKKLTELVPELQDWVETGNFTPTKNEDAETSPLLNCHLKYSSR